MMMFLPKREGAINHSAPSAERCEVRKLHWNRSADIRTLKAFYKTLLSEGNTVRPSHMDPVAALWFSHADMPTKNWI